MRRTPTQRQALEFYGFFTVAAVVGLAVFVVNVLNLTHAGLLIAVAGLAGAGVCVVVMVRGTRNVQRWRREDDRDTTRDKRLSDDRPGAQ
jgi:membrane protein implicated in regulation of membrane protease activity